MHTQTYTQHSIAQTTKDSLQESKGNEGLHHIFKQVQKSLLEHFFSPSCLPTLAPTGISLSCPGAMPRLLHSPLIPCSFRWSLNPSSPRGLHKFLSMYDAERFSNPLLPFERLLGISSSTSVYLLKGSFHVVQCISKDNSAE